MERGHKAENGWMREEPTESAAAKRAAAWHKRSASDSNGQVLKNNLAKKQKEPPAAAARSGASTAKPTAGKSSSHREPGSGRDQEKRRKEAKASPNVTHACIIRPVERSITHTSDYGDPQRAGMASNKRSLSSAGCFELVSKRASACSPVVAVSEPPSKKDKRRDSVNSTHNNKEGAKKKDCILVKKAKINSLAQSINLGGKEAAPASFALDQAQSGDMSLLSGAKKPEVAKLQSSHQESGSGSGGDRQLTAAGEGKKAGSSASKYHLYENLCKGKKDEAHRAHKHVPSFCYAKNEVSKLIFPAKQGGNVEPRHTQKQSPAGVVSPYVPTKRVLCSVPISKVPSTTHSPEPLERNEAEFAKLDEAAKAREKSEGSTNVTKIEPPAQSLAVMPLSTENVEKLKRIRDAEGLSAYIRDYFSKNHEAPPTSPEFYRVGRLLGKGAFGKVNLGMHKLTGKLIAIKSIKKEYLTDEASKRKVMQEYSILKHLRHRNVIRLYESFESVKHILIVMELCSGGDLLNYVRKRRKLKEDMAKFVFKRLVEGLQHCHSRSVLHRDIKLDNVLLNADGELKICDFGVSKMVKKGERMFEQCGTPAYIAPEILRDRGYEGFEVDIWSAGVALFAMLYGTVPFKAGNMKELHKLIMKGKYTLKDEASKEARDLLSKMLECDPKKRITVSEILVHEWLRDVDNSILLFTDQEKDAIEKEYCYRKEKKLGEGETNTLFTEQNIDSTQNELTKNNTTKSVILAPFNSTITHQSDCDSIDSHFLEEKKLIKFAAKVRDIDRQYEKNNNGDVDNGVYNKFVCDSNEDENKEKDGSESDSFGASMPDDQPEPIEKAAPTADSTRHERTKPAAARTPETTFVMPSIQSAIIGTVWLDDQ